MTLEPACTHRPRTTRHLSISWCSSCQDWLLHVSQSGRRDSDGNIVLIEQLEIGSLGVNGDDPVDANFWFQRFLMAAVEMEHDRIDMDLLRPAWRLRSV